MSALPRNVREQVERANEIIEKVYPKGETPEDEDNQQGDEPQEPQAESKPEPKPEPDPPKTEESKETDWEHKFRVLQGKYNAEVPRLQRSLQAYESDNSELKQRITNLETMLAAKASQEREEPKSLLPDISQEEREQFGEDLIDLIERVSKRATLPEIAAKLKPLEGRVTQVDEKVASTQTSVAESKRQKVFDRLAAAVPDWEKQNEDVEFLNWLDQEEGMTGKSRGHFLTEAMKNFDADRVVRYFTSFRSENAAGDNPEPAPEPRPKPTNPEPQVQLEDLTAPGTPQTGTASAPTESGKRVWTRKDIAELYAEKNEFIKKGRPVPKRLVNAERDLLKAQNEGRLR